MTSRSLILATAALGAVLAAGSTAALAQSATDEMRREQANPGATPWVPGQNRAAAEADAMGMQGAHQWLAEAETAVQRGQYGRASELLERAETRLLSRSRLQSVGEVPIQDPAVSEIAAARQAVQRHDRSGAMQALASARGAMGQWRGDHWRGDMATGSKGYRMPAEGGPGMMPQQQQMQPMAAPAPVAPAPAPRPLRGPPSPGNLTP